MPTCRACGKTWQFGIWCPYCGANTTTPIPNPTVVPPLRIPNVCPACGTENYLVTAAGVPTANRGIPLDPATRRFRCTSCHHLFTREELGLQPAPRYTSTAVPATQRLQAVTGKKVKAKLYEVLIFEIAGMATLFIPQFLGIGVPLQFIAIALMSFIPGYYLLPSESDVVNSIRQGGSISQYGSGLLLTKSALKMMAAAFIIGNLFIINRLMALIFAFVFYFTLHTRYQTSRPYQMIEAWARVGVGVMLSYFFFITFGGPSGVGFFVITGGNPVATSLFWMGLAFFATLPIHIEDTEGRINIRIMNKYGSAMEGTGKYIDRLFFSIFMIISLFAGFLLPGTVNLSDVTQIMFLSVWAMSFFAGFFSGPEARPSLGILMIFVSLFAFSSSYTGYVGQAIFGYYWPQVRAFGETYLSPLGEVWAQAQTSMADAWEILTCPPCYYEKMRRKEIAIKSIPEGTIMSMEIARFDLLPSMPGYLEPREYMIGSIEIMNKGEYASDSPLKLDVWSMWENATTGDSCVVGKFRTMTCGNVSSTFSGGIGTCNWPSVTYPTEARVSTFVYERDPEGASWQCPIANLNDVVPRGDIDYYRHSGEAVKVNSNLTYKYKVNVSIPIEVIDFPLYVQLLENEQIQVKELLSRYTGGPVKATLYTQRQPLRTQETAGIIGSIYNEGRGMIKDVTFKIRVPESLGQPSSVSSTFDDLTGNPCITVNGPTPDHYYEIECTHKREMKPEEFRRITFFIIPPLPADVERKTSLISGFASYTYLKTQTQMLQVVNAPFQ